MLGRQKEEPGSCYRSRFLGKLSSLLSEEGASRSWNSFPRLLVGQDYFSLPCGFRAPALAHAWTVSRALSLDLWPAVHPLPEAQFSVTCFSSPHPRKRVAYLRRASKATRYFVVRTRGCYCEKSSLYDQQDTLRERRPYYRLNAHGKYHSSLKGSLSWHAHNSRQRGIQKERERERETD